MARTSLLRHCPGPALVLLLADCTPRTAEPAAAPDESCKARLAARPRSDEVTERSSLELTGRSVAFERDGVRIILSSEEFLASAARLLALRCPGRPAHDCAQESPELLAVIEALNAADPASSEPVLFPEDPASRPRFDLVDGLVADLLEHGRFVVLDRAGQRHSRLLLQRYSDGAGQRQFYLDDAECRMFHRVFDWIA